MADLYPKAKKLAKGPGCNFRILILGMVILGVYEFVIPFV